MAVVGYNVTGALQQYLPFTVLKHHKSHQTQYYRVLVLQQYLPFTVLKHLLIPQMGIPYSSVVTVLTVYGIETL